MSFRILFLCSLILAVYSCGFQKIKHPPLKHLGTRTSKATNGDGRMLEQAYESIRIYADYSNLESIDPLQKDYIQNQIMPSAISYYQSALKIKRESEPLVLENSECVGYFPSSTLLDPGVDADLAILVVAEYIPDVSFVAAAVPCSVSTDDRPNYGLVIFNLAYLPMEKVTDHQENLSTALHELAHVLGFNPDLYPYFRNSTTGEYLSGVTGQKTVNGMNVPYVNVEPLTSRLRTYFGCPTLEGAYLENDGDYASFGAHFERRVFMNEYMTATSIPEPVISEFTLALLEGSGWYQPNYNMTEPFTWGRDQGCPFLDGPCVGNLSVPNFMEFCDIGVEKGCTYTSRGVGFCGSALLQDYFADSCPYYTSTPEFDCKDASHIGFTLTGETYGLSSRCYTGTLVDSLSEATHGAYCFSTQCEGSEGNYVLTLMIGTENITCTSEGPLSVAGYNGLLDCPDPNEFCARANPNFCEKGCSGRGTCVGNRCECPAGWGGTDCAERVFVENCALCADQTGKGCYGDQCLSKEEILGQ